MQVEGIYTAEPRFEAKAKALKLKQEMAAAAAEEQRVQKEKQYAQERNYGGGFGSDSAYVAEEKPQKTADTGFSGGQRGGFGGQHAQEPQTVQDTDTTLGWKLLRILNAGSGKFFSGFGQAGSKIVGGLEEVEQYLNGGWTSDGQYVKGDSPIVSSLLGWVHGAADDVTAQANAELDRSARNWSDTKAGQVFNEVAVNGVAAIPQAMLAFGTGGASTAGQLGAQAGTLETALRSLVSNPRFWLAYGQNAGESYAKAKAAGASDSDALVAGTFTGLTNAMIDLGGGYENSGWMSDRSLNGGQIVKNLGKSVLEQSGEEYAKGAAGRMVEKLYTPDKQWYSTKDENAVFNPKRDARQLAADAATAALVEGSGYAARRLADDWNDWGRKQREEDRLLSEEEFDTAFERGYNEYYREDASSPYLQQQLNYVWRGEKNFIPQYAEFDEVSTIAGMGTERKINDINRLTSVYRGTADEWKKQSGIISSQKYIFDVHWYEKNDGIQHDLKLKYRKERFK